MKHLFTTSVLVPFLITGKSLTENKGPDLEIATPQSVSNRKTKAIDPDLDSSINKHTQWTVGEHKRRKLSRPRYVQDSTRID